MLRSLVAILLVGSVACGAMAQDITYTLAGTEFMPEKDTVIANEDPGTPDHNYGACSYRSMKWHQFNMIVDWSDDDYSSLATDLAAQTGDYGTDYVVRLAMSSITTSGATILVDNDPSYVIGISTLRLHAIMSTTDWVEGNGTVQTNTADGATFNSRNGLMNGNSAWTDAAGNSVSDFSGVIGGLNEYTTQVDYFADVEWTVSYYDEELGPQITYNYLNLSAEMVDLFDDPNFQGFALSSDSGPNTYVLTQDQWGDVGNPLLAVYTMEEDDPALPGDFDGDGDVDGVDFGLWQVGYPTAGGATLADGDADGDGDVDGTDFGIWQANYTPAGAAVPEPATMSLIALGGIAALRRRK